MIGNSISDESVRSLSRWITCFSIVSFDIEEGQKMDLIVPRVEFSKETEKEIAMLAFPDSNNFSEHENTFKYTFKVSNGLFGFTCFKQKKDSANPRGFSQRSLVILSELPFIYFFEKMAEFIVFKTFNTKGQAEFEDTLIRLCQQVAGWPAPVPKCILTLPILQYDLQIEIPNYIAGGEQSHNIFSSKNGQGQIERQLKEGNQEFNLKNILSQEKLIQGGPFQELELADIFNHCKDGLWSLWEKVMLNRSVLLLGDNPQQVSHGVLGGISLIYPFEYSANFNPYITVYDPSLDKLVKERNNWVFGGTNPVFEKLFDPSIITTIPMGESNGPRFKSPKHLRPVKELLIKSKSEEQKAINEAAIRKHFHQLGKALVTILETYLNQQSNNLKFFDEKDFVKKMKEKKEFLGLETVFSSKKYALNFIEQFIATPNFDHYLASKNTIRIKK